MKQQPVLSGFTANIQLTPFEEQDLIQLDELQPQGWQDLKITFQNYLKSGICFPFKHMNGDKLIGIGASIIHRDTAWLGHIIVHPGYRNKGIGLEITQALAEFSHAQYCNTIYLIATELGAPVYVKAGFETETEYLFYKDINLLTEHPVSEYIAATSDADITQILSLDKLASGEDRAEHLSAYLKGSFVYRKDDGIEGFYLPAWGDGLITARNGSAGLELMKLRLMQQDSACFPAENIVASAYFKETGYKACRTAKRMRLGVKRPWKPTMLFNRIGGNLG
ncbi:MAG: GNAT family N-acetyltransferase [Bacteroidia bacterium]